MKSPPLTLTASASLRATAIMLESPTPTPNSSNAPFVVEAITFYAASYQRFDADIRRAELNDEALPPFAELESHLLNIDESRGLTLPSQNQRNYNQHAHSTRQQSHHFQSRHPKLPIVFSHNVNNKLSAPSFAHIQTLMATIKTEVIHRDHRKTIRARSDLLQILRDHLQQPESTSPTTSFASPIQPTPTEQSTTFPTNVESKSTTITQWI
ncbi:hypothetical protein MHU86_11510 [Fragilaria crotonensis]|nr:hypothetical protein MHU86_11510 [Fragilaria crotonensis]